MSDSATLAFGAMIVPRAVLGGPGYRAPSAKLNIACVGIGGMGIVIDGTEGVAGPGTLVHVPGGATHSYQFGQGGIEMISMTSREGASRMYVDFDREGSWDGSDRAKLIALAAKHGQVVVPKAS